MTEAEAIDAVTDFADIATTFLSLYLSLTFAYLTVVYFLGSSLSRFQCIGVSILYGVMALLTALAAGLYTKATQLILTRGGGVFDDLPQSIIKIAWMETTMSLYVGGILLSFYFMRNVRQAEKS